MLILTLVVAVIGGLIAIISFFNNVGLLCRFKRRNALCDEVDDGESKGLDFYDETEDDSVEIRPSLHETYDDEADLDFEKFVDKSNSL